MRVIYIVESDSYRPEKISKILIDGLNRYMKLLGVTTEIRLYRSNGNKISLKKRPNLIHIFDPRKMTNLFKYVIKIKIPYVITFADNELINELTSDDEINSFRKILENALLVTVTTNEKKEILNRANLNTDDVLVIPHSEREQTRDGTSVRSEELESELFKYFQIYNIVR